jgi:hypothetical protein
LHNYIKQLIRKEANCVGKPYRIIIIHGNSRPKLTGNSYYWTTPSGKTIIRHPNAYRWAKIYSPSTRRIEVGINWLHRRGILLTTYLLES